MRVSNIKQFNNGWFLGNFEPSLLKTKDFEIAHHIYPQGFHAPLHYHKEATEYNYIVSGKIKIKDQVLTDGDIFIYEPREVSEVEFLLETSLIIVKTPSVVGDKFLL